MTCFLAALTLLAAGACCALLTGRRSDLASLIGTLSSLGGGLLALAAAWPVLAGGRELTWSAPWEVPAGEFAVRLDPLAAWFVLPIAVLGLCCALFGASYLRREGKSRSLAPHWFYYNLLLAAMLLVVTAANAVLFLAAWEIMTLASFFLVAWDHCHSEARRAAWLYLLAAHCGLMFLLALFLEAGVYCGGFNFAAFTPLGQLPAASAAGFFLLALVGFGVKAGLLPLHIWLPDAHPAAPSHISALMSGVLVKTGIYGLLRILSLLPPAPAWWGWLLAGLGILGALYGIALACLQSDIKRCLAYSTIENVGIVFLGLGFGLVAQAQGHPAIALLACAGAMLHIWNHALFKGLMFLGAGALVHATGSRAMNRMGGLLRRMPLTGLFWIGGSLAISALPPLNGLVSEWLIYLGLLQAGLLPTRFIALPALLLVGLLAAAGALALVTFVRLVGICLLGSARSTAATSAHEATPLMLLPMALLLAGCLAIGLWPEGAFRLLQWPLSRLLHRGDVGALAVPLSDLGRWGGALILALLAATLLLRQLRRSRSQATAATWGCGYPLPTPRMAYTGAAFSALVGRGILPRGFAPALEGGQVSGLLAAPAALGVISLDPVLIRSWQPLFAWLAGRCQRLRWLQQGRLPVYLLYLFATLTLLLAWIFWVERGG